MKDIEKYRSLLLGVDKRCVHSLVSQKSCPAMLQYDCAITLNMLRNLRHDFKAFKDILEVVESKLVVLAITSWDVQWFQPLTVIIH